MTILTHKLIFALNHMLRNNSSATDQDIDNFFRAGSQQETLLNNSKL